MKKADILVLFFVLLYGELKAQNNLSALNTISGNGQGSRGREFIASIVKKQTAAAQKNAGKTTAVLTERLKAYSLYDFDPADSPVYYLGKVDSGYYVYSGQRGSSFDRAAMGYYYSFPAIYNPSPLISEFFYGFNYANAPKGRYFEGDILSDSAYYWSPFIFPDSTGHLPYTLYSINNTTYDANDNVTGRTQNSFPTISGARDRSLNTYNSLNEITSSLSLIWSGSSWDTNSYTIFFYNSANQFIEDSTSMYDITGWYPDSKQYYNYGPAGDLVYSNYFFDSAGTWQEQTRYVMTYNADHSIRKDSVSIGGAGVWMPESKDSFGYTPGVSFYTFLAYESSGPGYFDNITFTKHVAPSGLPDSVHVREYASYGTAPSYLVKDAKSAFTYDSYNNPVMGTSYRLVVTDPAAGTGYYTSIPNGNIFYYYETYLSSADVPRVSPPSESITIFPNPAMDQVSICRPEAAPGTFTTVKFVSAAGQLVRTETLPWMEKTETFTISGLAPGVYLISVADKDGNTLSTQKIIKR